MNQDQAVIMMVEALASEGASGGGVPFVLKVGPGKSYPVGFASRHLAERLMARMSFGRKVWLESARLTIKRFPASFLGGEIVYFEDRASMDKFVNEGDFLPVRTTDFLGLPGTASGGNIELPGGLVC